MEGSLTLPEAIAEAFGIGMDRRNLEVSAAILPIWRNALDAYSASFGTTEYKTVRVGGEEKMLRTLPREDAMDLMDAVKERVMEIINHLPFDTFTTS